MKIKFFSFFATFLFLTSLVSAEAPFLDKKTAAIGKPVDNFELSDTAGKPFKLSEAKGTIVLFHFWSATCPFVKRYEERLQTLTNDYAARGVEVIGIASNVTESPDEIRSVASERNVRYPILLDPDQKVADQFGALTTPHIFILNQEGTLAYEGAVDDQGWGEKSPVKKNYARDALDALLSNNEVREPVTKTVGCTVKRPK